jgi:hypothetical protein
MDALCDAFENTAHIWCPTQNFNQLLDQRKRTRELFQRPYGTPEVMHHMARVKAYYTYMLIMLGHLDKNDTRNFGIVEEVNLCLKTENPYRFLHRSFEIDSHIINMIDPSSL